MTFLLSPLPIVPTNDDWRYSRRGEGRLTIPAAVGSQWTPVASIAMSPQEIGYIVGWWAEVNDPSWDPANSSIAFQVSRNAAPYLDLQSVQQPMGDRVHPEPCMLSIKQGDVLIVSARRIAAGGSPQEVNAGLMAVVWPMDEQLGSCKNPARKKKVM